MTEQKAVKVGDKITVYTSRGNNWRLEILEVTEHPEGGTIVKVKPGPARSLYLSVEWSKKGIPYAEY